MARILIKSYGCSASMNDGEIMAGILERAGHRIVGKPEVADVIIVNTCIVKGRTEARMRTIIRKFSEEFPNKRLIVAGCMAQVGLKPSVMVDGLIGPHNIDEIVEVATGDKRSATENKSLVKTGLAKKSASRFINIVQILEGCSGACAYCIVKQAKSVLCSFSGELVIDEIKAGLKRGQREVWLTSQDNASYGLDKNAGTGNEKKSQLPRLLNEIGKIEGKFVLRVGMMNPDTILPVLDELVEAYKSPKVFKFLHIPVQSGNDRILRLMNRKYSVADFKRVVAAFRKAFPEISISTDIIVGFPSETEEQFRDSMRLIEWLRPDVLNLSRFVARPNTAAEKMGGQVHGSLTKERSEEMSELFYRLLEEKNRGWKGWRGEVYFDERGKAGTLMGRNIFYRPIVVKDKSSILGSFCEVEVVEGRRVYLEGRV